MSPSHSPQTSRDKVTGKGTRKRTWMACIFCRGAKRKCVIATMPKCERCTKHDLNCDFVSVEDQLRHNAPSADTSYECPASGSIAGSSTNEQEAFPVSETPYQTSGANVTASAAFDSTRSASDTDAFSFAHAVPARTPESEVMISPFDNVFQISGSNYPPTLFYGYPGYAAADFAPSGSGSGPESAGNVTESVNAQCQCGRPPHNCYCRSFNGF